MIGLTYPSLPANTLVITLERETRLKCWKTIPILRRMRRISSWLAAVTSCPFQMICPPVGSISRLMQRSRVDFPEPLKPITARNSPWFDVEADLLEGLHASIIDFG